MEQIEESDHGQTNNTDDAHVSPSQQNNPNTWNGTPADLNPPVQIDAQLLVTNPSYKDYEDDEVVQILLKAFDKLTREEEMRLNNLSRDFCKTNAKITFDDLDDVPRGVYDECRNCGGRGHIERACPINCTKCGHATCRKKASRCETKRACRCTQWPSHIMDQCIEPCLYEPCKESHPAMKCPLRCCMCGSFEHKSQKCPETRCLCGHGYHLGQKHGGGCMVYGCGKMFCLLHCNTCGIPRKFHRRWACRGVIKDDFTEPFPAGTPSYFLAAQWGMRTLTCRKHTDVVYKFGWQGCPQCSAEEYDIVRQERMVQAVVELDREIANAGCFWAWRLQTTPEDQRLGR